MKRLILTLAIAATLTNVVFAQADKSAPALNFDLAKFAGKWYEISYIQEDEFKRDNLQAVTVNYVVQDNNKFVENFSATKKRSGKPVNFNTSLVYKGNGIIKAAGGGKCQVLAVDANYQYIMLGTTDLNHVWILSRTPNLDATIYNSLIEQAAGLGFAADEIGLMAEK